MKGRMAFMYTLFIQKKKGDNSPFPLTRQLHDFLVHTQANGIFFAPGHLSKEPRVVEALIDNLLDRTNIQKFGIGNRFAGNYIQVYENHLNTIHKLWRVTRNNASDHRKMVFVFQYNAPLPDLDAGTYKNIIQQIEILGVVIGSSNFSYQTYGGTGGTGRTADKGEADIFMFFDESFKSNVLEQCSNAMESGMVLSKSLTTTTPDFLKRMFEETLEHILR